MKIFVGYGYHERDQWIEKLVFPIIQAFGDEVVTGKELYGQEISVGVKDKIRDSNAVIGFTTRRDALAAGGWTTHQWVRDELLHAVACKTPIVEVREQGVEEQNGMLNGLQRIPYAETGRDLLLVEIVKAIGKWHAGGRVRMQLLPQDFVREIWPLLKSSELRCTYRFLVDYHESEEFPADILKFKQGLFIVAREVPREALIQVQVQHREAVWTSAYQTTDSLDVLLERS